MIKNVIKRLLKVPTSDLAASGNSESIARQLDIALMDVGFKMSGELLGYVAGLSPKDAMDLADEVLNAVRELVGDHVEHNVYFLHFPENVPDTMDFWMECIVDALYDPEIAEGIIEQIRGGFVNLLDLPKYGRYQHTYEDMLEAHEKFIPSLKDRVTILHLGKTLREEIQDLYLSLAGSQTPLNDDDRNLLSKLAEECLEGSQPELIPVRENRAVVNRVRVDNERPLLVDTATDVLRLACALSDGDETLQEKTRFKSFSKGERRVLMNALDSVISKAPEKLADVAQYSERWKRLGERLHPYDFKALTHAQDVFAVARRDKRVQSLAAKAELAFALGEITEAIGILAKAPGMLFRNLDRILRRATPRELRTLLETVQAVIPRVSGRVILSVREHLLNRTLDSEELSRIFTNRKGTAWVTPDTRDDLDQGIVDKLFEIFDGELLRRMPAHESLLVDKEMFDVAIPLSDKNTAGGFNIMPRGTVTPVTGRILRLFAYWKERSWTTDFDLSVILLDENFEYVTQISWSSLKEYGAVHSGDLTEAPDGASEFIDLELGKLEEKIRYIVPSINVYSGESFLDVEESIFGYMELTAEQKGKPFEPRTVRTKFDVRGKGKVGLPLVFMKDDEGDWSAQWLHLYLNGRLNFNRVEINRVSTAMLARSLVARRYMKLTYLISLMREKASVFAWNEGAVITEPVTHIGLSTPEGLPEGSTAYTLRNLSDLIPK